MKEPRHKEVIGFPHCHTLSEELELELMKSVSGISQSSLGPPFSSVHVPSPRMDFIRLSQPQQFWDNIQNPEFPHSYSVFIFFCNLSKILYLFFVSLHLCLFLLLVYSSWLSVARGLSVSSCGQGLCCL